jgi:hypothetical protein
MYDDANIFSQYQCKIVTANICSLCHVFLHHTFLFVNVCIHASVESLLYVIVPTSCNYMATSEMITTISSNISDLRVPDIGSPG